MRLIDADELITQIESYIERKAITEKDAKIFELICGLIDNALTVEACNIIDELNNQIDDLSENLAWYINERNRLLKERRPQGKWINTRPPEMSDNIVCSLCGYDSIASFNYCPNCGAKMQKGGAE